MKGDVVKLRLCNKRVLEYNPLLKFVNRRGPRVALLYPAPYSVASQSLGFQLVYALLISEGINVERFTSDSCGRSLENGTPLKRFDYVLVSLSFELDYMYFSEIMRNYGREGQVVIAGGLAVTSNPIPIMDLVDYVILGDAEPTVPKLAEMFYSGEIVESEWLAREEGVKAVAERPLTLAHQFLPINIDPPWGKGFLIEVTRGCPHKCRFCLEGWTSKPFREKPLNEIKEAINGIGKPFEKIITISLSLGDYDKFLDYLELLASHELTGSIPSIRMESVTEEVVDMVKRMGQRTLTIAPETTRPWKARVLGKGFSPSFVKEKTELIMKKLKPKVYMMIVPGESEEEVKEEAKTLREVMKGKGHVSVNPLIPKPWTPLQIAPFPGEREEKALLLFKREVGGDVDIYPIRWARLQAAISLSEKPIGKYLDPSLPPSKLFEIVIEKSGMKEWDKWRVGWRPKWFNYKIGDEEEVIELGEESYEAWREGTEI